LGLLQDDEWSLAQKMIVRKAVTAKHIDICYKVRIAVFVEEQNIPVEDEIDLNDPKSTHFIGFIDGEPAGTARLVPDSNGVCHLGRLAVLKGSRNKGLAKLLVESVHFEAIQQGFTMSIIHAQSYLKDFYLRAGYIPDSGEIFIEDGLEHLSMTKMLQLP
jgi:predicted GNAT family N-acyltransferase